MIQQVCTIYRKNWGWPCHINNVSPVGQKTAWKICKYLAFVAAVLLSWPAFTSTAGLNPSAPLPTTTTLPWRANKANFLLHGIALHSSYQKLCVAPGVVLFIMFNISGVHHKPGRGRGKKWIWLLCPDWFSLDPAVVCSECDTVWSVRYLAIGNWELSDTRYQFKFDLRRTELAL